jgi:fimbrial chaperone protein
MRNIRNAIAILALMLVPTIRAGAFTMEPMTVQLAPTGEGCVATFHVNNDGPSRIAVRFRVLSRDLALDGSETNSPADSLFIVYPARVLVEPGSSAAVKIQWRGKEMIKSERCFRFVAEEVPVDAGRSGGSGLRVLFRYIASVYVGTPDFAPALSVFVRPSVNASGVKGFSVEVSNHGSRHVVVNDLSVEFAFENGESLFFLPTELGNLNGANYLPGSSIRAFIPSDKQSPKGKYEARLKYESEY